MGCKMLRGLIMYLCLCVQASTLIQTTPWRS
jgi:hypothetical protein